METWNKRGEWYDSIHDIAAAVPGLKDSVDVYDGLPGGDPLRELFVGQQPTAGTLTPMPLHDMDEVTRSVAAYLVHEKIGDLSGLGPTAQSGVLPPGTPQYLIDDYLSKVAGRNEFPYIKWSEAYQASIYVSEGEFDKIKPPEG